MRNCAKIGAFSGSKIQPAHLFSGNLKTAGWKTSKSSIGCIYFYMVEVVLLISEISGGYAKHFQSG